MYNAGSRAQCVQANWRQTQGAVTPHAPRCCNYTTVHQSSSPRPRAPFNTAVCPLKLSQVRSSGLPADLYHWPCHTPLASPSPTTAAKEQSGQKQFHLSVVLDSLVGHNECTSMYGQGSQVCWAVIGWRPAPPANSRGSSRQAAQPCLGEAARLVEVDMLLLLLVR